MQSYKNILLAAVVSLSLLNTSCKKFLTVSPSLNVVDEEFFVNQESYKEALNGVYLKMTETSSYGRELTFGLTDVLAGMYLGSNSLPSGSYRDAFAGNYQNSGPQTMINGIWSTAYNIIANTNKLIAELEKADTSMFTGNNYRVMKGEAYALRAYIHFDMLRLFGTSVVAGGKDKPAIPYVTRYSTEITPKTTGADVIGKINADLDIAENLLKVDPIYTRIESLEDNAFLSLANRKLRLNYYAVRGLRARVALWADDKPVALTAAEEIITISSAYFPWILEGNIATSSETTRDKIFTTENLFMLYVNSLQPNYRALLDTLANGTFGLVTNSQRLTEQFESANTTDFRGNWLIRVINNPTGSTATSVTYYGKYYQAANLNAAYARRIPMIRASEMYYIAAECLVATNPSKAVDYLNVVRASRKAPGTLSNTLTGAALENEIRKEYWKEFPLEGQMFHYYKRKGATVVPGSTPTNAYPQTRYVLPLPVAEIEFGM